MLYMGGKMERKKFSNQKRKKFPKKTVQIYKKKDSKRDLFLEQVERLKKSYEEIDPSATFETFEQLPLSSQTLKGLKQNGYVNLTDIQRESIVLALKGHDILGAAKTGSGKTLAFVIPMLECLFREGWSRPFGLGALVITPTRELAYQIYNVFQKVGKFHHFTVALVIGGKDIHIERKILKNFNIVICTPGRLLQHMDENPLFDAVSLQMLVLDEADRILDLGFAKTMNAILENLPLERQTLLFSATQTKSVKDLARLSLKEPKYVSVHEHAKFVTPESLTQSYTVMEAQDKINFLWSFLKKHMKHKILVFMASCKQVKYTYEVFCHLRPGISVTALYGSLHQLKRMEKYDTFCRKEHVVMFATDIAARGLDFPNVNWVIQLDCPEDVNTYIHRAGRTARYCQGGESLLVLLPSEKDSMLQQMETRRIPITEIQVNPKELSKITKKLASMCSNYKETLESAKRAFNAYLKSIFLMKDKTVFDVQKINAEAYARSLGLLVAPRTRFINRHLKVNAESQHALAASVKDAKSSDYEIKSPLNAIANESEDVLLKSKNSESAIEQNSDESEGSSNEDSDESENMEQTKSKPQHLLEAAVRSTGSGEVNSEDKSDVLKVAAEKDCNELDLEAVWNTTVNPNEDVNIINFLNVQKKEQVIEQVTSKKVMTKYALAKKILKTGAKPCVKIVFDEEGKAELGLKIKDASSDEKTGGTFCMENILSILSEADKKDREANKRKIREKHKEERIKLKEQKRKRNETNEEEDEFSEDDSQAVPVKQEENKLKQYIEELPDPDKFFDKDSESESDENMQVSLPEDVSNYDDEIVESMSETEQPKQRQKKPKKEKIGSSRKKLKLSTKVPSAMESSLALDVDEDFALRLLQDS